MDSAVNWQDRFEFRHLGSTSGQVQEMLAKVGSSSLDQLTDETIPASIRLSNNLNIPEAIPEHEFISTFRQIALKNKVFKSYIGLGYYPTITPAVIQRNIFENPGWYTAYTPYQAELAQGRLEALINYQTMVADLTGMDLSNASLLDEGTAAAEAMTMLHALRKGDRAGADVYYVDETIFPQTLDVLKTRADSAGIQIMTGPIDASITGNENIFGILIQYPDGNGNIRDYSDFVRAAKNANIFTAFSADLLSLAILTPPGEFGADIVTGSTQRFGIPMAYGGPHAAYFATREEYKRLIPGRIIGVSVDAKGKTAYRMALQTREQHIRREKATSNICTSQVLLAVMAGMYGVYHGPEGLKNIASKIHRQTVVLAGILEEAGYEQMNEHYFDTLKIRVTPEEKNKIRKIAEDAGCNLRYFTDEHIGLSLDQTTSTKDIQQLIEIFGQAKGLSNFKNIDDSGADTTYRIPASLARKSKYFTHPAFNSFHQEHDMLRYLKRLENKDLSLAHSMISLGSCTMKLNATSEMIPVSWPELADIHPFAPVDQVQGYAELFSNLESWLNEITGFKATSFQPNSGAQGEYSGLMVIRAYHHSRGDRNRNITLIPSSAHGTNPASAVMAGMKVIIVQCDSLGNIDVNDLKAKAEQYRENLAALMVTYPSTHGVFETGIKDICEIIHKNGGLVYMDGANMNAQVGLTNPAIIGADVCHLNLHKTFCIPHGGGGPGVGPICVAEHLKPFLPGSPLVKTGGEKAITAVSSAPWGSAGILAISYAYIRMMGAKGLKHATEMAILNANYVKSRLQDHFKILYTGLNGRVGHEFIIDCRGFKAAKIEVEDIAKRLMDYGFHAPTVSFPVPGTLMIEPTESESKAELDRFCDALISIRGEIDQVVNGKADPVKNVLKNAPHTFETACSDTWDLPYSREKAVFPLPYLKTNKFWPSVSRIDNAYGDRNLFCSCAPVEEYDENPDATGRQKEVVNQEG